MKKRNVYQQNSLKEGILRRKRRQCLSAQLSSRTTVAKTTLLLLILCSFFNFSAPEIVWYFNRPDYGSKDNKLRDSWKVKVWKEINSLIIHHADTLLITKIDNSQEYSMKLNFNVLTKTSGPSKNYVGGMVGGRLLIASSNRILICHRQNEIIMVEFNPTTGSLTQLYHQASASISFSHMDFTSESSTQWVIGASESRKLGMIDTTITSGADPSTALYDPGLGSSFIFQQVAVFQAYKKIVAVSDTGGFVRCNYLSSGPNTITQEIQKDFSVNPEGNSYFFTPLRKIEGTSLYTLFSRTKISTNPTNYFLKLYDVNEPLGTHVKASVQFPLTGTGSEFTEVVFKFDQDHLLTITKAGQVRFLEISTLNFVRETAQGDFNLRFHPLGVRDFHLYDYDKSAKRLYTLPHDFDIVKETPLAQNFTCFSKCGTCLGNEEDACLTCPSGYELTAAKFGKCRNQCSQDGFYRDDSADIYTCQPCIPGCKDCSDGSACQTCSSGYTKNTQNGLCEIDCQQGYYRISTTTCSQCSQGCRKCSSSAQCDECQPWLIISNRICKCPGNCSTCDQTGCQQCLDNFILLESKCEELKPVKIDYILSQKFDVITSSSFLFQMVLDLDENLPLKVKSAFQKNLLNSDPKKFISIKIPNLQKKYALKLTKEMTSTNIYNLQVLLDESEDITHGDILSVTIDTLSKELDPEMSHPPFIYSLINKSTKIQSRFMKYSEKPLSPAAETFVSISSTANRGSASASIGAGVFMGLFSGDPSGTFLKFNQYLTLINRIKFIGMFFGRNLQAFVNQVTGARPRAESQLTISQSQTSQQKLHSSPQGSARILELSFTLNQREKISQESHSYNYKFDELEETIFFEGPFMLQSFVFSFSWLMKVLSIYFLARMKRCGKIVEWRIKFIVYQRKVHFLVLMVCLLDIYFYGARILLHRKNTDVGLIIKVFCGINITLMTFDLLEAIQTALKMRFEKEKNYSIKLKKQNSKKIQQKKKIKENQGGKQGFKNLAQPRSRRTSILENLMQNPQNRRISLKGKLTVKRKGQMSIQEWISMPKTRRTSIIESSDVQFDKEGLLAQPKRKSRVSLKRGSISSLKRKSFNSGNPYRFYLSKNRGSSLASLLKETKQDLRFPEDNIKFKNQLSTIHEVESPVKMKRRGLNNTPSIKRNGNGLQWNKAAVKKPRKRKMKSSIFLKEKSPVSKMFQKSIQIVKQQRPNGISQKYKNSSVFLQDGLKLFIDHKKTIEFHSRDQEIELFSRSILVQDSRSYQSSFCLLHNIFQLLQITIVQVLVVALPHSPTTQIVLLLTNELVFFLFTTIPYFCSFRFISFLDFISRAVRFLFLSGFYVVCLIISYRYRTVSEPVDRVLQEVGIILLGLAIFLTYIVEVLIMICVICKAISDYYKNKGNKVKAAEKDDLTQEKRGHIFYVEKDQNDALEAGEDSFGIRNLSQNGSSSKSKSSSFSSDDSSKSKEDKEEEVKSTVRQMLSRRRHSVLPRKMNAWTNKVSSIDFRSRARSKIDLRKEIGGTKLPLKKKSKISKNKRSRLDFEEDKKNSESPSEKSIFEELEDFE